MIRQETPAGAAARAGTPPDDIQQALIDWVGECPYIDANEQILTDLLDPSGPPGYAVSATGSTITRRYLRVANEWRSTYVLYARFYGKENPQRQRNARFLQNFTEWAEKRARGRKFFPIARGEVRGIEVSNGMIFDADEGGNVIYQVQIRLDYYKEV